ncbi:hypothetical protein D3C84_252820 [compost metagenome]
MQLQAQAFGQIGARVFHAHHTFDPQAQATGEVIVADFAFDHHHRVGLQQRLRRMERIGKQRRLNPPRTVVEGDETHLVALLVLHHPQGNDHPRHGLRIARRLQVDDALTGETADLAFVFVDRVTGQVQAQGVFLTFEALLESQLLGLAVRRIHVGVFLDKQPAKQVGVTRVVGTRGLLGRLDRLFHRCQQHGAVAVDVGLISLLFVMEVRPQTIQRTAADQAVEGTFVDALEVDPRAEIEQILERTFLTRLGDRLNRAFTDTFDRAQAVNDAAVVVHRELELRSVHVRRVETQLHRAHFLDQGHDLVGVVHVRRKYRCHERRRVVSFQPRSLVRDQAVGGGVGFVEAVTGEFFYQVENVTGKVGVDVVGRATFNETAALLGHFLGLFLTHGSTQHVRTAEGVAGHDLGNLHHLFLIQDDAVSRCQYRLEAFVLVVRVRIRQFGAAVLTVDEVVHHARLQRARTEQCHQCDQVFQAVGLELFDQLLHAPGFKLEHRRGFGFLQQGVGRFVVQRDERDIQRRLVDLGAVTVDGFQRPVDDRQGPQTEEVELHQTGRFNVVLVELGHQTVTGLIAIDWREVSQFGRRNNHTTGVFTNVTHNAFELARHFPDFRSFFINLDEVTEDFFLLVGFFQGHADFERNHLRQTIRQAVGLALHPRHVAHHRLGGHGTEGDDLAHGVAAVLLGHVVDHPVATVHAEVDVEVGHGYPFRVEETFEQQVIFQRVEVGDLLHIGHQRPGTRSTARTHRYAVVLGPLDKVHHDQEVTGEAHLDDDIQLEIQPIDVHLALGLVVFSGVLGQQDGQALFQAIEGHLAEILVDGHAIGNREVGQEVSAQFHFNVAALGDLDGVFNRVRNIAEQLDHFLGAFQVLLIAVILRAPWIVEGTPLTDAHAGFVGGEVFLLDETHIVGRHQRRAELVGEGDGTVQLFFIVGTVGALDFQIETIREYRHPFARQRFSFSRVAADHGHADLAFFGGGQHDQAFVGFSNPLALDDDHAVALAFDEAARDQLGEVAIALGVHHQQAEPAQRCVRVLVRQPQVGAADRLDARAHGVFVEFDQGTHVVLVGDRDRRHVHGRQCLDQRLDPHQPVDQGVFSVQA